MVSPDVTQLLADLREGHSDALDALLPVLYGELRALAARQLAKERRGHTLEPTALVHEAWLKLVDQRVRDWQNRAHFMAIAATAMRRVLVDHAVAAKAQKRGGGRARVTLIDTPGEVATDPLDVIALDQALEELTRHDPRKARVVELRFFAGLENAEAAAALGVAERTVERDWRLARAWLRKELSRGEAEPLEDLGPPASAGAG